MFKRKIMPQKHAYFNIKYKNLQTPKTQMIEGGRLTTFKECTKKKLK